jgi:hypothetical protein
VTYIAPLGPSPSVVDGALVYTAAPMGDDPIYWIKFLGDLLTQRWQNNEVFDRYYQGNPRLPSGPTRAHSHYRRLLKAAKSNWSELIVDAVAERLRVIGFRWAGEDAVDLSVWQDLWQRNDLDAHSEQIHTEALVWGYAYALVWPQGDGTIRITAEHPSEVICYAPPTDRTAVTMALKRWSDDWGYWHATLYTPTFVYKYVSTQSSPGTASYPSPTTQWEPRGVVDEPWPLPNPFDRVPVVEFPNNPRLLLGGRSELGTGAIDVIDRINETVFNRLLAAQYSAFRQKWVTGMEIPRDPETGDPIEPFNAAVDRLWMAENPDTHFGEFGEAALSNYISAAEADITHLASITRTPAYYLLPGGVPPSGEALKTAETGLVAKVQRRAAFFGESWEAVLALALTMQGDPRAQNSVETLWQNPAARGDVTMADTLIKLRQLGVPDEVLWEMSGFFSPEQIDRIKTLVAAEPPVTPMPPSAGPGAPGPVVPTPTGPARP